MGWLSPLMISSSPDDGPDAEAYRGERDGRKDEVADAADEEEQLPVAPKEPKAWIGWMERWAATKKDANCLAMG